MYQYYGNNKKITKVIERYYDNEGKLTKEVETHYEEYPTYPYQPYVVNVSGIATGTIDAQKVINKKK